MRRPLASVSILSLLASSALALGLVACRAHRAPAPGDAPEAARPAGSATPSPATATRAATPAPHDEATRRPPGEPLPEVDRRPFADWFAANAARVVPDPSSSPEDLTLAIDLVDWVARGSAEAAERAERRLDRVLATPGARLRIALRAADPAEAQRFHTAAGPLTGRPQSERDPEAEDPIFRKALLLNPSDPDLWTHLAVVSSLRKDFAAAARYAKVAIGVDPGYLTAYQELAYAFKNAGKYREAVEVAERGLKVDGDLHTKALLLARQGQAYWMLGDQEKALGVFRTSKRLGGPPWVESYLDGKQEIGKAYKE